jgi:hypothetical protein
MIATIFTATMCGMIFTVSVSQMAGKCEIQQGQCSVKVVCEDGKSERLRCSSETDIEMESVKIGPSFQVGKVECRRDESDQKVPSTTLPNSMRGPTL